MHWQNLLEALSKKLRTSFFMTEIETKIQRENELMACLLDDQEVRKLVSLWLDERYNTKRQNYKCVTKAKLFKTAGNKEFQAKDYPASIQSYTKSAIYAPADSEELPVAIANRSASLFYLGKYEDCIKDIELAIKLGYPEKLQYKVYLRAVQCYVKLKNKKLTNEALRRVRDIINKHDDIPNIQKDDIEKRIAQLTQLASRMPVDADVEMETVTPYAKPVVAFGENPDFPCASIAIDKKYSSAQGRYVVANRDIKRGQILFVEKPFTFVLMDNNGLCEHCCHPYGDVPIPCTMCLDTLYCNIKCWEEGWSSYHRWECPGSQMGLWHQIGIAHLALKVLLTSSTTTDTMKFNEVQKLVTNFDRSFPGDLLVYGITATMLTLYLIKYTDFFKANDIGECLSAKFSDESYNFNCDISKDEGKWLYVGSLLLRHILQLVANGHAITKLNLVPSNKERISTEQQDSVATAIYPSASMMNHSCDPNIINSFMDHYLIVKAAKDIPAGHEVYNCYGPDCRRMSKELRQEILQEQYCFTCKCEPCTLPEFHQCIERFTAIKCPECGGALTTIRTYYRCLDCGAKPVVNCHIEIKEAQDLFKAAQVYIDLGREEEALSKLKQCLSMRRVVLYKYHEDITATLDLIGKVYAIMGRWLDSISYLEHCLVAVKERFGSASVELANELNKLTDICIRYLQEEPNTTTKWYKNILKKTRRYLDRADEILQLNYGPWTDACREVNEKKELLATLLKGYNV